MTGMTPEREAQVTERLHAAWHAAPNGCPPARECPYRRRARSVARILGPVITGWIAEDVLAAKAELDRLLGDDEPTQPFDGGGVLASGGLAYNESGRPERVLDPDAGGGGGS